MGARRLSRALVAVTTAAVSVGLAAGPVRAEAPLEQGWWTITNVGPVAAPTTDVPEDGLLVQGSPAGPSAYSALVYEIAAGATANQLVLTLDPDAASTPAASLQLCVLVTPAIQPAQGGPMADAPPYDCAQEVTASPADDGTTYTFDVVALVSFGALAVAVLPTTPSDRVVFAKPGPDSLVTTPAPTTGFDTGFEAGPTEDPPPAGTETGAGFADSPSEPFGFGGSTDLALPDLPPVAVEEPLVTEQAPAFLAPEGEAAVPTDITTVAASTDGGGATAVKRMLLVLALAVAAGLWMMAGRFDEGGPPVGSPTAAAGA